MIKAPRGTRDILTSEIYLYQYIEKVFHNICKEHGYTEIRTPVFEETDLFTRSVGETSDIVKKEMYTFSDKKGRSLTLRPEGTAPIVRAYIENSIHTKIDLYKVYYIASMFRYDRPQAGRYRQFHQLGIEAIGSYSEIMDTEVIKLSCQFLNNLGIKYKLNLNSVGCKICRPCYQDKIRDFLKDKFHNLCDDCKIRHQKNPLRILDCKIEECKQTIQDIPEIFPFLCDECSKHFNTLKNYLEMLNINYILNKNLVRGLDYYTKTTFEITPFEDNSSQSALLGGGRYDDLIESLGGPKIPAIGMAAGEERIASLMKGKINDEQDIELFIATIGEQAEKFALTFLFEARKSGIKTEMNTFQKSLKSQLKYADKISAKYVLIIGDNEIKNNIFILRDMQKSEQKEIKLQDLLDRKLFCRLKGNGG